MVDIEKGIVINKINYGDNDEVITFITQNNVFSLLSLGSRKLTSKNRNALQFGSYIEIEYFKARLVGKMSKLKKATLIKQVNILQSDNAQVLYDILSEFKSIERTRPSLLLSFLETYDYWGLEYNHQIKTYIVSKKLEIFGLRPITTKCVECGTNERIINFDFFNGGFECVKHSKHKMELEMLKAFKYLFSSFEDYIVVDPLINKQIFEYMKQFLYEHKG